MRENDRNYIPEEHRYPRFVSDAEASRRIPSDFINPDEVIEIRGDFNSIDGTHPHTQEEADIRDAAFLERHKPATE